MKDISSTTRQNSPKEKKLNRLLNIAFYFSIMLFFIGFNFADYSLSGWYQQFLPNINNRPISDITFLDSLIGFSVTPYTANDTAYILKTTNGGDNWLILFRQPTNIVGGFNRIQFLNQQTGFACGNFLWKTTNGGITWFNVNTSGIFPMNMYVLNQDTIWIIDSDQLVGGVFFTSNGGLNWTQQFSAGTENPNKIYMYNARIGFICNTANGTSTRRTTDGGNSWSVVITNEGFRDMYFADSLIGWRAYGNNMYKTINGGLNWLVQYLPTGANMSTGVKQFSNINIDTIWGTGGSIFYPSSQSRGLQYRTTNGGNNWYYQIPDTTIHIPVYYFIKFINNKIGWSYSISTGIHTITGGDTSFLSSIQQISNEVPKEYILFQNYPNPFNEKSNIKYQISKISDVQIKIFDIQGKEISILVNKKQTPGTYEYNFEANNLSSGIYFYTLFANGKVIDTKKAILLK